MIAEELTEDRSELLDVSTSGSYTEVITCLCELEDDFQNSLNFL